jgi:hypothetical protein
MSSPLAAALLCTLLALAPGGRALARDPAPLALELGRARPGATGAPAFELDSALLRADDGLQPPAGASEAHPDDGRARSLRWWGRTLRWSTAAALVATSTLGTLAAINQPTAFGDGRCITGNPVFGDYGCDRGLSTLHGSSGVLSVTLYTANAVLGLAAPESRGVVSASARPLHRALTWVHLGGIVVQPVLGLVAAFPQVIGKSRTGPTDRFPRDLRTAHVFLGYVTTAAFLTTVALER